MVAAEKAGIPAVAIAARSFARAWQSCVDGWGQPNTAFVTIPHATTGQQADFIRNMVDDQIDAIIQGLTELPASAGRSRGSKASGNGADLFTIEMDETPLGMNAVNDFLAERDWSDGIPVIPPTPAAVEQMLMATKRQPGEVVMVMEPGFGLATVEKIAINAVMAGCRPEQFPVLLAAIDCLAQPEMNHRDMHRGFQQDESAVTLATVSGPTTIIDAASRSHEDTLDNIGSMMFYRNAGAGGWLRGWQSAQVGHTNKRVSYKGPYHPIILSPSRAVIMAEAGMSKRDAQEWLHRNCTVSLKSVLGAREMPTDDSGKWLHHAELQHLADDPGATIPALESPEQYLLFVSGGSTHYSHFFYGTYGIATMPVENV